MIGEVLVQLCGVCSEDASYSQRHLSLHLLQTLLAGLERHAVGKTANMSSTLQQLHSEKRLRLHTAGRCKPYLQLEFVRCLRSPTGLQANK